MQVGRGLRELGVQMIPAYSPQAWGRSKRNLGTLAGTVAPGAAAARDHHRGSGQPISPGALCCRIQPSLPSRSRATRQCAYSLPAQNLDLIFSLQFERTVNRDNTVSFQNLRLQIEPVRWRGTLAGCNVTVHQHLDGSISLTHGPHRLGRYDAQGVAITATKNAAPKAVEKTLRGKVQKPTFPPRLEIPPMTRDSHFPPATATTG